MLGLALTVLVSVCSAGVGAGIVGRWTRQLDSALRIAVNGLVGLGVLGTLTLFVGLLPEGFGWGIYFVAAFALVGAAMLAADWKRKPLSASFPDGLEALIPFGVSLAVLVASLGVLTPSTAMDWDSLAYHLAIPKLYLQAGHIYPLFIHQSNFPSTVDLLYVWGLLWGGQSGAKAFSLMFLILGSLAAFGITRQRFNPRAAGWAAIAFAWVPVIVWESGTGYIDVANGVYAGLGILFAALFLAEPEQRGRLWLSGICLGFAAGTKYTGLETIFAVGVVMFALRRSADGLKAAAMVALVAAAIASPWYVKTAIYTGNPVFPFFYKQFGGKNWDERRSEIYTHEQHTFGIGRSESDGQKSLDPKTIGAAIFGLDYQPGRYVNPGQTQGLGTPLGAIGVPVVLALFLWTASGRGRKFEGTIVAVSLLSLVMWFVLSQQSRYIVPLVLPLAVLVGGGVKALKLGPVLAAVTAAQSVFTLWMMREDLLQAEMKVLTGRIPPDMYQSFEIPFYTAAQTINRDVVGGKVALYDEVFGFLLDVPYMWANPGHSTIIPYDSMKNEADYVADMKKLGFTHVYVNARAMCGSAQAAQEWYASTGLSGPPAPFPDRQATFDNWQTKYRVLIAEAIAAGDLRQEESFPGGCLLLEFQ